MGQAVNKFISLLFVKPLRETREANEIAEQNSDVPASPGNVATPSSNEGPFDIPQPPIREVPFAITLTRWDQ